VAATALAGCGTQPIGRGAPPYDDQPAPSVSVKPIRTRYPDLSLTFRLPRAAGADEEALRTYVAFTVASTRSTRSGTMSPGVRSNSSRPVAKIVESQVAQESMLGVRPLGPTRIEVRDIQANINTGLQVCVRDQNGIRKANGTTTSAPATNASFGVLLGRRHDGRWYVASLAPLKERLRNC